MSGSLGPFEFLDPPPVQTVNAPPVLPSFVDGRVVRQSQLNALGANLRYLQGSVLGGKTGLKPLTVLRAVTPVACASGLAQVLTWDVADKNTDGAWSVSDPKTVSIQTEGWYRIYFQAGTTAAFSSCMLVILVNGADVISNATALSSFWGNHANIEISVPLARTASVQAAYMQSTGSSRNTTNTYGGCRLEVEFMAP